MAPAAAASAAVAARACGPSSLTRSVRVSGPRLLLSTTSWPASTASRATVLPMFPLPMSPMVVTSGASRAPARPFPTLVLCCLGGSRALASPRAVDGQPVALAEDELRRRLAGLPVVRHLLRPGQRAHPQLGHLELLVRPAVLAHPEQRRQHRSGPPEPQVGP